MKLHLGCGKRYIDGYIHIDAIEYPHIDHVSTIDHLSFIPDSSIIIVMFLSTSKEERLGLSFRSGIVYLKKMEYCVLLSLILKSFVKFIGDIRTSQRLLAQYLENRIIFIIYTIMYLTSRACPLSLLLLDLERFGGMIGGKLNMQMWMTFLRLISLTWIREMEF